ncbi:MAG: nitroreductase family protein [Oscillospiraceae bacterium]|nr:nitroreductase family protein [Oscillospiraceae bacterium]
MNETLRQLRERKSVRVYEDRPIGSAEKQAILDAAIQAPSAGNMALYTILDITDQKLKDCLAVSCDDQPFIATAPMVLIFCADYRRWYDVFRAHVEEVRAPGAGDLFLAEADAIIAAQNAVVAAQSLGIGSCYIGDITERFEYHRELLKLPKYVVPAAMVCFGYPTRQQLDRPKPRRHATADLVHENGYDAEKSADMARMLADQQDKSGQALAEWIRRFCKRKWNSEFSREMTRSCEEMLKSWCED